MTKLQYINLQAKQDTRKQKALKLAQCAILAALFISPVFIW